MMNVRRRSRRCGINKGEFGVHLSLMLSQRARGGHYKRLASAICFLPATEVVLIGREAVFDMLDGGLLSFHTNIDCCEYLGTILQTHSQASLTAWNGS